MPNRTALELILIAFFQAPTYLFNNIDLLGLEKSVTSRSNGAICPSQILITLVVLYVCTMFMLKRQRQCKPQSVCTRAKYIQYIQWLCTSVVMGEPHFYRSSSGPSFSKMSEFWPKIANFSDFWGKIAKIFGI